MEKNKYGMILDGKMDEPVWENLPVHSGFKKLQSRGGGPAPVDTEFKILPCEDRVYVGIKCLEPVMQEILSTTKFSNAVYSGHSVEIFLSPAGDSYEFYQFIVSITGNTYTQYYSEGGNIRPDPYKPDWNFAVHTAEDYWSVEIEIPLTAFYWTPQNRWTDNWVLNICRDRPVYVNGQNTDMQYLTWSELEFTFMDSKLFRSLEGFPMRPERDAVRIHSAEVELREETPEGYKGIMKVKTDNYIADTFNFTSDHSETLEVSLQPGPNEFSVPCFYEKEGRTKTELTLTRADDGKVFKRYYPALAKYEPIRLKLTLPEYRNNFYPGQDYSKIVGTVKAVKPVTLKLEGPGIETTVITPNADGSFTFNTPDFEIGEAWLTANIDGYELKKKIRRLAPSEHTMTWISGGNLVVNGKPTLRRNVYAMFYRGGKALEKKFSSQNMYDTRIFQTYYHIQPDILIRGSENAGGESTKDAPPSEEMYRKLDAVIEKHKDEDFAAYYISDEPECRGLSAVYLKHVYDYVSNKDPYHVILSASRSADSLVEIADWFEAHPYLNPLPKADGTRAYERPLNSVGAFIDKIVKLNRPDKCIGFLPTCFAYKWQSLDVDYPTFDEYIGHTWAAMMRGGKSLWPYAFHDLNDRASLFEGNRYVFSSFAALEDLVLLGKRTTLAKTEGHEAVLYDHGDEKMFVLVNFDQFPKTVTLEGLTGTWHEFRGSRTFTGNTFQLKPLETVIGTNVVKGADLPTYAEVAAEIDRQEYARTHSGSLLYERTADIRVTTSEKLYGCTYKLFDGTPDNLAFKLIGNPDNYVELDLTKVNPTFTKVAVRGYGVDVAQIKVRKGEELIEPAIKETACEEYAKIFLLAEAVTPDSLRIEMQGKEAEFYEIEVFA